ncbi:unnamed protein product [Clonostachys rhizophaga]|uniref:Peptidase S8/S53 domain-containing protein n=1 Tax=Clonostachys rhizophaga TaxID=160324 RepID=A0A9N9V5X7_9HYPO|nr:unnamed protein product [Clonostachys rhizophaga]
MAASAELEKFLKENGLDLEKRKKDRSTAIHRAVLKNNSVIVGELLDLYPEDCRDARDKDGRKRNRTPIQNAAQLGLHQIVAQLLAKGAQVDSRSPFKWTALIFAAADNRREVVSTLLKNGADVHAKTAPDEREKGGGEVTALHVAAQLWSAQTTLKLLLSGANPNAASANGDTPLHFAVRARSIPCAALLLFHGASATARNKEGITTKRLLENLSATERRRFDHVFSCAKAKGNHNVFLQEYPRKDEVPTHIGQSIHWAIDKNLEMAVAYLLHADPYAVEAASPRGWHPLHRSARHGLEKCVQVLLQHGAEVDCLNNEGWTPLMFAARFDKTEIVQLLLDKGANRDITNDAGETALQLARTHGHRQTALRLAVRFVPPSQAGEMFALTDASITNESTPAPEKDAYLDNFFGTLEETWYNRIHWTPDDDEATINSGFHWYGPVKIAVLDTGVDLEHEDFTKPARRRTKIGRKRAKGIPEKTQRERIVAARNFVGEPGEENDVTDEFGHGTHIAGLIMAVAPRAELYIAKVSTGKEISEAQQTAKASTKAAKRKSRRPVEDAIRWAIEQKVDIINLSLGFSQLGSYELTRALDDAVNANGIIVFAAAANHGNNNAIAWPARSPDLAICVSSGDKFQKLSPFAPQPSPDFPMFVAPGEEVWSQWPTKLGGGFRKMSGTSVSTPIAVGMAAIILGFLNMTNVWDPQTKEAWLGRVHEFNIRRTRGMRKLLTHLCRDRNGVKILSPDLMWEDNHGIGDDPLQALNLIAWPFKSMKG